jgi:hypothetical protein
LLYEPDQHFARVDPLGLCLETSGKKDSESEGSGQTANATPEHRVSPYAADIGSAGMAVVFRGGRSSVAHIYGRKTCLSVISVLP